MNHTLMQQKVNRGRTRKTLAFTNSNQISKRRKKVTTNRTVRQSKRIKKSRYLYITLALLIILPLVYIYSDSSKKMRNMGIDVSPLEVIQYLLHGITSPENAQDHKNGPQLQKDVTGTYTNALIVGIDTRANNNGLQNTDSVMVVSYNHETEDVVIISIPRDIYVKPSWSEHTYKKINSIYNLGELQAKDSGLDELQWVVEKTLDIEIQYYALIDFAGFIELIDIVGGVEISVDNSFTDYMYPLNVSGYETVRFTQGEQTMDGDTALKYARSRKSLDAGEGSDFARAKRQQKVITALKEKLTESDVFRSPTKLWEIMETLENQLKFSGVTDEDIDAIIKLSENKKGITANTFVLSPSIGNGQILTERGGQISGYAITPIDGLGQNAKLQEFIACVLQDPLLYHENPDIYVYNSGIGYQNAYNTTQTLRDSFPYLNFRYMGNLDITTTGIIIYNNKTGELGDKILDATVDLLSTELDNVSTTKPPEITDDLYEEDITIVLGESTEVNE